MTRLSTIHPYPAMLSDPVAEELAHRFVRPGDTVLDPFCGTGRGLLAAAARGAQCVGVDVNPLACLVTLAKTADVSGSRLDEFARAATRRPQTPGPTIVRRPANCKVDWFPAVAAAELGQIVGWINGMRLSTGERVVLGAVLSATTREVSFARKSSWKLHRIDAISRATYQPSAWLVLSRRLTRLARHSRERSALVGSVDLLVGDSTRLCAVLGDRRPPNGFDIIMTSPPYGDSRTTVQYGGISRLCLSTVRHLRELPLHLGCGESIDPRCLGGAALTAQRVSLAEAEISQYWSGGKHNKARPRVCEFLSDLSRVLDELAVVSSASCRIIMVLGRRLAGGRRLRLDKFVQERLARRGFTVEAVWDRKVERKLTPFRVNTRGRMAPGAARVVRTMAVEYVLVLDKSVRA